MAFAGLELRYPRALDPRPSWMLGDALEATRRSAPPTPLKQPPEWASGGNMGEKAFVMRVEEEDHPEEEDDTSDGDAGALVSCDHRARFSCNDLESSLSISPQLDHLTIHKGYLNGNGRHWDFEGSL
uniref:Uncharacterized protein n=4 Tax=Aegilops tauschii subsp. strangulata TaxID=200361 RepID=A0A452XQT3_AEGTS